MTKDTEYKQVKSLIEAVHKVASSLQSLASAQQKLAYVASQQLIISEESLQVQKTLAESSMTYERMLSGLQESDDGEGGNNASSIQ